MVEARPAAKRRSAAIPLIVIALFVLPIVLAWWLTAVNDPGKPGTLLNHGIFIRPPIDIEAAQASRSLAGIPLQVSDWAMVYVGTGACAQVCARTLELLSTIRSVIGHDGTRVHVAALVDDPSAQTRNHRVVVDAPARKFISTTVAARTGTAGETGILFLDWRGQLMMYFPIDAAPADIKADLKRLLRGSAIR